jgi:signal transduction histidine kinase
MRTLGDNLARMTLRLARARHLVDVVGGDGRRGTGRSPKRCESLRRWAGCIGVTLLVLAAASPAMCARVDAAARTVRVGVYQNKPKVFMDESGHASGIFIDVISAIGTEEGWTIVYVPCAWNDCLASLGTSQIDLMPDVAYSTERDQEFDFHKIPVLTSWSQVYARPELAVGSFDDLAGRRVAVLQGSIQQTAFEQYMRGFGLAVTMVPTASLEDAFKQASNGSADAAIANNYFGDYYYQQYGLDRTPIIFQPATLFYATAEGRNADLLEAIDRHLNAWLQEPNSPYYAALTSWTAAAPRPVFRVPDWVYWAIAATVGLLLMAAVGLLLLRWQVQARTRRLREANQAIRQLNAELEQRVAERTADLAVARDKAEEADRLKSAFLATMSHELRTPLNSIIGFTGIVLQELAGPLNEEQHKQLEMVRESANHLLKLINDVLDISKIEAGQLDVSSEPFDLRASLLKVAGIVKPLADKKGLELRVTLAPEIDSLVSDPRRVEQVVLNLLNNAIKFTERGAVTLAAEVSPVTPQTPDSAIHISVADTGIGIKAKDMDKLFAPFRQVDTGLSRQHEGTGLGLAICQRLAELLGGEILVSSRWGKGSTFTLTLPRR